jgi:hypothetical protein
MSTVFPYPVAPSTDTISPTKVEEETKAGTNERSCNVATVMQPPSLFLGVRVCRRVDRNCQEDTGNERACKVDGLRHRECLGGRNPQF